MKIYPRPYQQLRAVATAIHGTDAAFSLIEMERENRVVSAAPKIHYCNLETHLRRLRTSSDNRELYVMTGQSDGPSMRLEGIAASSAIGVDLDHGLPPECAPDGPLAPSLLIETSPGRFHAVWLLKRPVPAEQMGRLARGMASRLGGDMCMARANQMVRLPNSPNLKYLDQEPASGAEPEYKRVKLIRSTANTFDARDLWDACDVSLYEASLRQVIPSGTLKGKSPSSDEKIREHAHSAAMHLASRGAAKKYESWWKVLVNLVPLGDAGRDIAMDFSKTAPEKFDADEFDRKWLHLATNKATGDVVTLFAAAQREGWINPGFRGEPPSEASTPLTDRQFGRMLAKSMSDDYAAVDPERSAKSGLPQFLHWTGRSYSSLDDRQRRGAIELVGGALAQRLKRDDTGQAVKQLEGKLGTNRGLDEIAEHVGEQLVPICTARTVAGYPYLPVQNGVLNLLTQSMVQPELRPVPRRTASVEFDPSAKAPRFMAFLEDIMLGDQRIIRYVLRVLGYALLGKPKEQVLVIFLGATAGNGKSTLLELALEILGPYAGRLKTEALMQKSHVSDGASPALSAQIGKRLVVAAEPGEKHRFDTSLIKQLAGESSIQVRDVYTSSKDMPIEFTLIMSANRMPYTASDDNGMWRRLHVISFDKVVRGTSVDRDLRERLLEERSGILNMLLGGLAEYLRIGLMPPRAASRTTSSIRAEADPFATFIQECCIPDATSEAKLRDLWSAYLSWAQTRPEFGRRSKRDFQAYLEKTFQSRTSRHLPVFDGVKLAH